MERSSKQETTCDTGHRSTLGAPITIVFASVHVLSTPMVRPEPSGLEHLLPGRSAPGEFHRRSIPDRHPVGSDRRFRMEWPEESASGGHCRDLRLLFRGWVFNEFALSGAVQDVRWCYEWESWRSKDNDIRDHQREKIPVAGFSLDAYMR